MLQTGKQSILSTGGCVSPDRGGPPPAGVIGLNRGICVKPAQGSNIAQGNHVIKNKVERSMRSSASRSRRATAGRSTASRRRRNAPRTRHSRRCACCRPPLPVQRGIGWLSSSFNKTYRWSCRQSAPGLVDAHGLAHSQAHAADTPPTVIEARSCGAHAALARCRSVDFGVASDPKASRSARLARLVAVREGW